MKKQGPLPRPLSHSEKLKIPSTGGQSGRACGGDGEEPHNPKPGTSQLTLIISEESEFADDPHQVIPTEDCYGLPLVQRQCGGFECDYQSPAEVEEFQGIYYYESGYLKQGYTNAMPYDHPLD